MGWSTPSWVKRAGRVAAGVGTGGLSELANMAKGGKVFGDKGSTFDRLVSGLGTGGLSEAKRALLPDAGPEMNAMAEADKYMKGIPGQVHKAYDPFIERSNQAYENISPIYQNMTKDPAGYLESIMQQYKPSSGYDFKMKQALDAAGNSAAAGGVRGGMQDIQNEAHISDMLTSSDMQDWLKNVMGLQGAGLQGQQGFYDTGFNAASGLSSDLTNYMNQRGSMAFNDAQARNSAAAQSRNNMLQSLLGLGGTIGGAALGGPAGAAIGSGVGNNMSRLLASNYSLNPATPYNPASRYSLGG